MLKNLVMISAPPAGVIVSAACITALGIGFLYLAKWMRGKKISASAEVLRDVAIAFIVAATVTVVYEANTRSVKEHSDMLNVLNAIMGSGITEDVWGEVQARILQRNQLRRGARVELKLMREMPLPDGRTIPAPPNQLVVFMRYEYDLYALTSGQAKAWIWYALDWQMYDSATDLPRFLSLKVERNNQVIRSLDAEGIKNTKGVFDSNTGIMSLEKDLAIDLPPPGDKSAPLHITTERYEIVSFPGAYTLYMPEAVAPPLHGKDSPTLDPTIRAMFESLPDDIEVKLQTYLQEHVFNPSHRNERLWEFYGIMLPGQAVSFTFSKKPRPSFRSRARSSPLLKRSLHNGEASQKTALIPEGVNLRLGPKSFRSHPSLSRLPS